jgi:hypothetical protein
VLLAITDMLLTGDRSLELKVPGRGVEVGQESSWRERWAYHRLLNNHLIQLAVIADAATYLDIPAEVWTAWHWPLQGNRDLLGRIIVRTLWRLLSCASTSPFALHAILSAPKSLKLPAEETSAAQLLDARLQLCFPEEDIGTKMLRYCLARVLSGWILCKRDAQAPLAARWNTDAQGDRVLPAANSPLWQLLPAFGALCDPVRWLASSQQQPPASELVRAYLRLEVEPVPDDWWDVEPAASRHLATLGLSAPTATTATTVVSSSASSLPLAVRETRPGRPTASIYTGSVIDWVQSALHPQAKELS